MLQILTSSTQYSLSRWLLSWYFAVFDTVTAASQHLVLVSLRPTGHGGADFLTGAFSGSGVFFSKSSRPGSSNPTGFGN